MIDLARFVQNAIESFDGSEGPDFPLLVGKEDTCGKEQDVDIKDISHISHQKTEHIEKQNEGSGRSIIDTGASARASGVLSKAVGNVGNVGKAPQINGLYFPHSLEFVGNVGKAVSADALSPLTLRQSAGAARSGWDNIDALLPPDTADRPALASYLQALLVGPDLWRSEFGALNLFRAPCPGFRGDEWRRVHAACLSFLETHADAAHALGWTALDLFAVNIRVGAANVSDCGALMVSGGATVARVEPDVIHFERDGRPTCRFWRPAAPSTSSVVVWEFGA